LECNHFNRLDQLEDDASCSFSREPIGISNRVLEGRRTLTGHIGTVLMASAQPAGAGFAAVSGS
jgi:hypothetical protein